MSGVGFIAQEEDDTCELCGAFEETRPYGPNGERVCYTCGMKDESAAMRGFEKYVLGENNVTIQ